MKKSDFPTKAELERLSHTDILTVDPDTLTDIEDVTIDTSLPLAERVSKYVAQIGNPYCYKSNGIVVKISFAGETSLENCLEDAMYGGE